MVETKTRKCMKILRYDQGGEYKSRAFHQYYKRNGILQYFICHIRLNKMECEFSILQGKNIYNGFWDEAINTIIYLKNRIPTKTLYLKTYFEAFYGYKPKVSHFRASGCKEFGNIPKYERKNLIKLPLCLVLCYICSNFFFGFLYLKGFL